jgi:hypothetical protein
VRFVARFFVRFVARFFVLSVAELLGEAIYRIHSNESISAMFGDGRSGRAVSE